MDLAVERVDLHCIVEVAGPAVPPQLAEEVALADFQRFVEEAGLAGSQRFMGEARLAGSIMVVEFLLVGQNWFPRSPHNIGDTRLNTCSMPGPNTPTIICLNMFRKAL
jgi:hypothetical protein